MAQRISLGSVFAIAAALWASASLAPGGASVATSGVATAPADLLERGRHLVTIVGCAECHGANLAGAPVVDDPSVAVLWSRNITSGAGGFFASHGRADFTRALRLGIGPDGKKLLVMPSWDYAALSDRDLASIYTYVRSMPPVNHRTPPVRLGPKAAAAFASDDLQYDADVIARSPRPALDSTPAATPAYGAYLARIAGCEGCHGEHLSGSPPGSSMHALNLTPRGIGDWTMTNFVTAIRTGVTPTGGVLSDEMPWKVYAHMSDAELHALYAYLKTLPPRATGG